MAVMFMLSYRLLLQRFVLGSDWSLKSTFHDDLIKMQLTSFWKTSGITSVIMGYHGNRGRIVHYPESSLSIIIEMIPAKIYQKLYRVLTQKSILVVCSRNNLFLM